MDSTTLIGVVGAAFILLFFILSEVGKVHTGDTSYSLGNFIGSGLLCTYSIIIASVPFAILEGIWALTALHSLIFKKK